MAHDDQRNVVVGLPSRQARLEQPVGQGVRIQVGRLDLDVRRRRSTDTSIASPRTSMSPSV